MVFALAYIESGESQLVSRTGNVFCGFKDLAESNGENLHIESAILDGEIACVNEYGRPIIRDLLFRRRSCVFIAFDLLFLNARSGRIASLSARQR
jgi:ATP-dependent DNA ligase